MKRPSMKHGHYSIEYVQIPYINRYVIVYDQSQKGFKKHAREVMRVQGSHFQLLEQFLTLEKYQKFKAQMNVYDNYLDLK